MSSGTATNRTYIDLPSEVSAEILQKVQYDSAVMKLARRVVLPGHGLTIPMITSDPTAAWVSETADKPVSNPGITEKLMTGYTLAVIVPFSKQFRRDVEGLYAQLVQRLPRALAEKFDYTVFHGSQPGSNFDVMSACTAQSLASDAYGGLVAADGDIAAHGGILNGFALSPQGKSVLLSAVDRNDRPLFINSVAEGAIPMILGARTELTKAAYKAGTSPNPAVVGVAGDWTQAMYGIVEDVDISISEEATLKLGDDSTINLWQKNMFAVRAEIEIGFRADLACFNLLTAQVGGATGATGSTAL